MDIETTLKQLAQKPHDQQLLIHAYELLFPQPSRHNDLIELANRALRHDPASVAARIVQIAILFNRGMVNEGLLLCAETLAIAPEQPLPNLYIGIYLRDGTHRTLARARQNASWAVRMMPDYFDAIVIYAGITKNIGPVDESIKQWKRAVELNPNFISAHVMLAELLAPRDFEQAKYHLERAIAINPNSPELNGIDVKELNQRQIKSARPIIARYPDTPEMASDLQAAIKKYALGDLDHIAPFLDRSSRIFTMGSCFARNIGRAFERQGYKAKYWTFGEAINSTYANRAVMDWMEGQADAAIADRVSKIMEESTTPEAFAESISSADIFVLTMGVAPAFFERDTGKFVLPTTSAINFRGLAEKFAFRTPSVQENVDNMTAIIAAIRRRNSQAKIFISISPVPLTVTFEMKSALNADCISKSTLRVTAHELLQKGLPELYYWPAFEIVRWMGGHVGPFFGNDDGASWHVSEALVDQITGLFIEKFTLESARVAQPTYT